MLRVTIAILIALFVGFAAFLWVVSFSSSFQSCISQEASQKTAENGEHHNKSIVIVTSHLRCAARFADNHNGIITAMATVLLFFVTGGLVLAGHRQIQTSRAQLRAYLLPEAITVIAADHTGAAIVPNRQISEGTQPIAAINWKNYGQTPAFDVEMSGNIALVSWPLDPGTFPALDEDKGRSKQVIGPTGVTTKYEITETPLMLDMQSIGDLQHGRSAIVVFGRVDYRDAFGRKCWTNYRYFTGGPTGIRGTSMSAHDQGNEAK